MSVAPDTSEELGTLVHSFLFTVVEPLLHRESIVSLLFLVECLAIQCGMARGFVLVFATT